MNPLNPSTPPPRTVDDEFKAFVGKQLSSLRTSKRRPYYTLRHGQNILPVLDALIRNPGTPQKLSCAGVQPETVRAQFYQACEYVREHLDPDGKYANVIDELITHRERSCIVIRHKGGKLLSAGPLINYRMNLEAFIDVAASGDKFPVEPPVVLSDEEVIELLNCLRGLEELFLYRISRTELEVIRV